MHHQTGLLSVNNISIRQIVPPILRRLLKLSSWRKKPIWKKKKKRARRWNSTLDLDSSTSPWTAKAIPEYSNERGSRFDLRFEERNMKKKVFRACL